MTENSLSFYKYLALLRKKQPLILNLTNYVTMDLVANTLLALGASPLMSGCKEEFEDLVSLADAVYINIGTLDTTFIHYFRIVSKLANQQNKPVILDPVGAGASTIRTETTKMLLPFCTIIKGNASEIMSLAGENTAPAGVDAVNLAQDAVQSGHYISDKYQCCVIISGESDFIINNEQERKMIYGTSLMTKVTGMGCALGATVAAFSLLSENVFDTSCQAVAYFGLCGQKVSERILVPGSFRSAFIDELYTGTIVDKYVENQQSIFD